MKGKTVRTSADKEVVKAGKEDSTLWTPGTTRAQKLRGIQPRSRSTAEGEDIRTTKSPKELTVHDIKTILTKNNISFDSRARKSELLGFLEQHKLHGVLKDNAHNLRNIRLEQIRTHQTTRMTFK
jgi:hypothetical protein